MSIHPTAIISDKADIAQNVTIGPYSVINGETVIGEGTVIDNHVTIGCDVGRTVIGRNNHFYAGAVVGMPPQDLSYKGEKVSLELGDNNVIRECVTLNFGTSKGGGVTKIGNECLFMAYVHIAHDCIIGNDVVIANSCQFGGHIIVEDHVKIGGGCLFNQFIKLGTHSYIAGDSAVNKDILPYSIAQGRYAVVRATNKIGLERSGVAKDEVENIHRAVRIVTKGSNTVEEALEKIKQDCKESSYIQHLVGFIKESSRGLAK